MNNQFIAAKRFFSEIKKTVYLYKNLWKERTTALLHAPRETEKTTTALAIASDIASKEREVLYVNAEEHLDCCNAEADGLYVFTPSFESFDDNRDYADLVFEAIENAVRTTEIRTFVIDSVSRIAALSFGRNASPAYIMKRLVALQVKCRLSLLVVANDSTKSTNNALLALAASEITLDEADSDVAAKQPSASVEKVTFVKPVPVMPVKATPVSAAVPCDLDDMIARQQRLDLIRENEEQLKRFRQTRLLY